MFIKQIILLLLIPEIYCDERGPLISISLGKIQGHWLTSHGGNVFSAFEGIPYAKPPTGSRRFKEPVPAEPWDGTLNATITTSCPQTSMINQSLLSGQEDCLHINIYVPREHPDPQEKLDVIVHIHGGAFMYGSGHAYANPEFLMDTDAVFVTFNYRLGIFGFLSTEDDVISGNNGLKDQVMALAWVQSNIASFGGNPGSVTLTGLSAGGASVHLHYLSKMSKGLFHRGFSQSGVALNPWVIHREPLSKAKVLAKALDCPTGNNSLMVECLRGKAFKDILRQVPLFFGHMIFPIVPFGPVIETGNGCFLDEDPYRLLVQGEVQDLPWLVSNTAHEGIIATMFLEKDLKTLNDKWEDLAPVLLEYNYTLTHIRWRSTARKVKEFYLGKDESVHTDNILTLAKMFSDRYFLVGTERAVKLQANVTKSPVFYYYFSYTGDDSKTVPHGKDRVYFFGDQLSRSKSLSPNELKMKNVVLDMLFSFAKTGKPEIRGIQWEPVEYNELKYVNISTFEKEHIQFQTDDEFIPSNFWESLGFMENQNWHSHNKC